jgi:hypothetical protein
MRLCETVLRPRCGAGATEHIEHIERIGHSDVDTDEITNRGFWGEGRHVMVASWRTRDGSVTQIKPVAWNLEEGVYGVYVGGALEKKNVKGREAEIAVELKVGGTEVELVVLKGRILS